MKFRYSTAFGVNDSRGKAVKRPMLEIELIGANGESVHALGLIDSGADTTTINMQYAQGLGIEIDETKIREIIGIGSGRVKVFVSNLKFRIKGTECEVEVPAWFVDSENVNILLGQEVFFDQFKIKFEKDHEAFEITAVKK